MNICKVNLCNKKVFGHGYCSKHYTQIRKYGKILNRTTKDPNEIIKYNDYAEIVLYNRKCEEVARTKIDLDDVEKCSRYKWCLNSQGYVLCGNPNMYLHRFIKGNPYKLHIDHLNWNKNDNRKCNLKIVTQYENNQNYNPKSNKYGRLGIDWYKFYNKWRVRITIYGKVIHLGYFKNLKDAIKARINVEKKYNKRISYV